MQDLLKFLKTNKSFLIWGFAQEGRSTYNFLRKNMPDVKIAIADSKRVKDLPEDVEFIKSDIPIEALSSYELVLKSPGISLHKCEISDGDYPITSQTELALRFFSKQIIGITGTKGKSTTATLIHEMLLESKRESHLVGNIGVPFFDCLNSISDETFIVYELSSHQLDNVHFSPHIAVLLNLYQEHLDYYGSIEKYYEAKKQIFRHQNEDDWLFHNIENSFNSKSKTVEITKEVIDKKWHIPIHVHKLSVQAVKCVANILNIDQIHVRSVIENFEGLPHRLELVGNFKGFSYYNDSISTAAESTQFALAQIPNVYTLIMGGDDRGIDYRELAKSLISSDVKLVITMFQSGKVLNELLKGSNIELFHTDDFDEALRYSKKNVLFSPASASYGSFKNFMQRGVAFKDAVIRKFK